MSNIPVSVSILYSKNFLFKDIVNFRKKTQVLFLTEESTEQIASVERDSTIDMDLLSVVELIFKSQACINASFLLPDYQHFCCTSKHHGVDLKSAAIGFDYLRKIENESLKSVVSGNAY